MSLPPVTRPDPSPTRLWIGRLAFLLSALLIAVVLRTYVVQTFFIPSGSMEATLRRPDRVLVNKVVYRTRDIRRGEIVVFAAPASWRRPGEKDFIKRVVGLPGDRVACCAASGEVTVNGLPLDEPYLDPDGPASSLIFDVTVPPGRIFVLGDHRAVSADSRRHLSDHLGTVAESSVVGRAFLVIWPVPDWRRLPVPSTYGKVRPRQ